ncbi:MAG: hypothetical protein HUK22_03660, partial [Thermoguttaceae bacterium]|nr:hypothetical protein [Thermoguttaceae bacterium]
MNCSPFSSPDQKPEELLEALTREDHDSVAPSEEKYRIPQIETRADETAFVQRRRWATTAIAALGYFSAGCAAFSFARDRWEDWSNLSRLLLFFMGFVAIYGGAGVARRLGDILLGNLLFLVGVLTYGVGLWALGPELSDSTRSAMFGVGAFCLASALDSDLLQCVAGGTICAWACFGDPPFGALTIVFCALGEKWAALYRRKIVANVYLAGLLVAVVAQIIQTKNLEILTPGCVALGLCVYWFGETLDNYFMRGFGIVLGTTTLAVASFPEYFILLGTETTATLFLQPKYAALIYAALFIVTAANLITEGARRCRTRLVFGVVIFAIWVAYLTLSPTSSYGAAEKLALLVLVSLAAFIFLFVERQARLRNEKIGVAPVPTFA